MKRTLIFLSVLILSFELHAQSYVWVQKASFSGGNRYAACGMAIGNFGYAGLGINDTLGIAGSRIYFDDFWQYDPVADSWSQMASFPGPVRYGATSFSINNKGYITTGWNTVQLKDLWEYDPLLNSWTQKADFGGTARYTCASFVVGNFAYLGGGYSPLSNDYWQYDVANDTWTQIADIGGQPRQASKGFAIGNYGYVFGGAEQFTFYSNELWQYDPLTNSWLQKSSCPGTGRNGTSVFVLNNIAYAGGGESASSVLQDFYSYDPITDTWTPIDDFGGGPRLEAISFSINGVGYAGLGSKDKYPNVDYQSDLWAYESTGEYNIIAGSLYIDANNNGVNDSGELPVTNSIVKVMPGPVYGSSNQYGEINIAVDSGSYTVSVPSPPLYYSVSPAFNNVSFTSGFAIDSTSNFGFYNPVSINDVMITITPMGIPRAGNPDYIHVAYRNKGTNVVNGSIMVIADSMMNYIETIPADSTFLQSGDTLTWTYSALQPMESRSFLVHCSLSTAVMWNDTIEMFGTIEPVQIDTFPADNFDYGFQPIQGAYDPNDKQVSHVEITENNVNEGIWLEYTIRFQNTGNAEAIRVEVTDSLPMTLYIASFENLATSHSNEFTIQGNGILKWTFDSIMLPDSNANEPLSHGFIKFRVKPNTTLMPGQAIENNAAIYFDFNPPVITNYAVTTVIVPTEVKVPTASLPVAFPNPAMNELKFLLTGDETDIIIIDCTGRKVKEEMIQPQAQEKIIDISDLDNGFYFVTLKAIKEKTMKISVSR